MRYFTTHPSLKVWPDEEKMTIGISVVCDRGESIVIAGDIRATYGSAPIGPNDNCGKVFRLSELPTMACIAGRLGSCHSVISELTARIANLKTKTSISREDVTKAIDASRFKELRKLYNTAMEANWGISLPEFLSGKVPKGKLDKLLLKAGHSLLENTPMPVELIVAGFMGDQTMFFKGSEKRPLEEESSPGVYTIGSGALAAMGHLNKRGQGIPMSLARSLLHVHEAMSIARESDPLRIGNAEAYFVTKKRHQDILFIRAGAPILESWKKVYKDRNNTASLDDSGVAAKDIYHQLKIYPVTGEDT